MSRLRVAALLAAAAIAPAAGQIAAQRQTPAAAQTQTQSGPAWAELKAQQQAALAPLKEQWAHIDANRKTKWLVVAQRFPSLPLAEQQRVQARMAEWAKLTPAERGSARLNFQELRNLQPDDRHALWEAYRALPDDQKRELAQRAKPAPRASEPASKSTAKRSVAVNPASVTAKPVTPTAVQAKPGATTTLVTKTPSPPPHHQPGLPKITASDGFVNPSTLLPNRGPQGAATHPAAPAVAAMAPAANARPAASAASQP